MIYKARWRADVSSFIRASETVCNYPCGFLLLVGPHADHICVRFRGMRCDALRIHITKDYLIANYFLRISFMPSDYS